MTFTFVFFSIAAIIAIAASVVTITNKNPVVSAMSLVLFFFMLAALYLTLQAQLVAIIQVLVYAGAIMVLVVFVIMLLNLGEEDKFREKFNYKLILGSIFAVILVIQFVMLFFAVSPGRKSQLAANAATQGTVQSIGNLLFTQYLFPFEAISLLLLSAIIGAVILAKRKTD